jgi:hypothetical protein
MRSGLSETVGLSGRDLGRCKRAGLNRPCGLAGSGTGVLTNAADAGLRRCVEPDAGLRRSARHGRDPRSVVPGRR